jgi:hypothetical protein
MRKSSYSIPPTLGLRNRADRVEVIIPNGTTQPVLGTRHPDEDHPRADAIKHFGGPSSSPRQPVPAAIELPLPQRSQTILTHQLPRAEQDRLNGGGGGPADSRRRSPDGGVLKLRLPD